MTDSEIPANDRVRCLTTALGYVSKDRNTSYGDPEDNFKNIAEVWHAQGYAFVDAQGNVRSLEPTDVALMMAGMKLARLKYNPTHDDSWIDLAGYAACGMDTANAGQRLNSPVVRQEMLDDPQPDPMAVVQRAMTVEPNSSMHEGPHFCGLRSKHPAHNFRNASQWCDGWSDLDTIMEVADKTK